MNTYSDSVRVVLFDEQNVEQFLVLSEKDDPENFKLPGGKFESSTEAPLEAANRELREELGLENTSIMLAGELVNDDGSSKRFIFKAFIKPDTIQPSDEIFMVQWVNQVTLPETKNKHHILTAVDLARH